MTSEARSRAFALGRGNSGWSAGALTFASLNVSRIGVTRADMRIAPFGSRWSYPEQLIRPFGSSWSWLTPRLCCRAGIAILVRLPTRPSVPSALRTGPFTPAEAIALGVTRGQLRGSGYSRLGSGFYRWSGLQESPQLMLTVVARRLPSGAEFSGRTAAWLHGLDVPPCDPIEVTVPERLAGGRRTGAIVRRATLAAEDVVLKRGLPTTSALRAVADLGPRGPLTEGVVAVDLALHARLISIAELRAYVVEHPATKGICLLYTSPSPRD